MPADSPDESSLAVIVEGADLPGRTGLGHENIHVGLRVRAGKRSGVKPVTDATWGLTGLVPGDAASTRWDLEIEVRRHDGRLDFAGPYVRGGRGDRHIGLAWGEVDADGDFELFRATKLPLDAIDPAVLDDAARPGHALVARLGLTSVHGGPIFATVRAPDLSWAAERT